MKLGEAKTRAIKLINEYSVNGSLVAVGNNKDYTLRMNEMADDVQREIANKVGIEATKTYSQTENLTASGYNKYALPTDFIEPRFVRLDDEPFYEYRIENGYFIIRKRYDGDFVLSYFKRPSVIDESISDDYTFEVDQDAQQKIPYFLAGMVIADENESISNKLLNIYFSWFEGLTKKNDYMPSTVANRIGW